MRGRPRCLLIMRGEATLDIDNEREATLFIDNERGGHIGY